eukprot:g8415.t1
MDSISYQERGPRTPPLTEFRNCTLISETNKEEPTEFQCAVSRHRKTRSGIPEFDPEDLFDFGPDWVPSESPPPFFKHSTISVLKPEPPMSNQEQFEIMSEKSDSDESLFLSDTPVTLPSTPCEILEMPVKENYEDSDQETCIAESVESLSEDDSLSCCNMDETLLEDVDDERIFYSDHDSELLNFNSDDSGISSSSSLSFALPSYIGLEEINSDLLTIPEEHEIHLDKTGNFIVPERTVQRASLQSIELDASIVLDLGNEIKQTNNNLQIWNEEESKSDSLVGPPQLVQDPSCSSNGDNKMIETVSPCTEKISPLKNFAFLQYDWWKSSSFLTSSSRGWKKCLRSLLRCCCPDLGGSEAVGSVVLQSIKEKIKTIGRILKENWPIIASVVFPIIVSFTFGNKSSE